MNYNIYFLIVYSYVVFENFVLTIDDKKSQFVLNFITDIGKNEDKIQVFFDDQIATKLFCKNYHFEGDFFSNKKNYINYKKKACYCILPVKTYSIAKVYYNEHLIKTFENKSNIFTKKTPSLIFFGDHDIGEYGIKMKNYLENKNFDLLFILGDIAYDSHHNNMKKGEEYFQEFENVFTKTPLAYTPGNHEYYNYTNNINFKLKMPYSSYELKNLDGYNLNKIKVFDNFNFKNNLYSIVIKNTLFLSVNWDLPNNLDLSNEFYYNWIKRELDQYNDNINIKFKVLLSHRPYFCERFDRVPECYYNSFYLKPFYDLLIKKYKFNLFITGHVHNFEKSYEFGYNMNLNSKSSLVQYIVGTGGCDHYFDLDTKRMNISHTDKFIIKKVGYLKLDIHENHLDIKFINIEKKDNNFIENILDRHVLKYNKKIVKDHYYGHNFIIFSSWLLISLISGIIYKINN